MHLLYCSLQFTEPLESHSEINEISSSSRTTPIVTPTTPKIKIYCCVVCFKRVAYIGFKNLYMHRLYCDKCIRKLKVKLSASSVKDKLVSRNGQLSATKFDEYHSTRSNDESIVLVTISSMREGITEPIMSIERSKSNRRRQAAA